MRNFAITGMGRSGSRFLRSWLNNSTEWTVEHEPPRKAVQFTKDVQARFGDRYGEVNSYLRWCINDLRVAKKGVLLRHPIDCLMSARNRGHVLNDTMLARERSALDELDIALDCGALPIRFDLFATSSSYLADVARSFGIRDVNPRGVYGWNFPLNASESQPPTIEEIPEAERTAVLRCVSAFTEKYFDSILPSEHGP